MRLLRQLTVQSLTRKFLFYLLFMTVVPLMLVGGVSAVGARLVVEQQAQQYAAQIVADQARYLDLELRQAAGLLDSLSSNPAVLAVLTRPPTDSPYWALAARERMASVLGNYLALNGLVGVMLLRPDGQLYNVDDNFDTLTLRQELITDILQDPTLNENRVYWQGLTENINTASAYPQVLMAVRPIMRLRSDTGQPEMLGMVVASYDPNKLEQPLVSHLDLAEGEPKTLIIILDNQQRVIYHPNARLVGTAVNPDFVAQLDQPMGTLTTYYNDTETSMSYHQSDESGWFILGLTPTSVMQEPAQVIILTAFVVFGFSLSIAMLFAWSFNQNVVRPIDELTAAFQQSQQGPAQWHIRLKPTNEDEMGLLIQWFNAFMESLQGRAETELALREQEEQYRVIFEAVNNGLLILAAEDGRVVAANPAAREMFGWAEAQGVVGWNTAVLFPPAENDRFRAYWQNPDPTPTLFHGLTPSGHELIIETNTCPIQIQGYPHSLIILRDITSQLQTERALRRTQKLESLGVMAGGIAHDFNNLLVAMLAQNSLALQKLAPDDPAARHVHKAVNAANRAADLTRQMLAYSGKGHFAITQIDLNQLLQQNVDLLQAAFARQINLELTLAAQLPTILGDAGQLQQVIMNLVLNAAEAITDEEGHIWVETYVTTSQLPQGAEAKLHQGWVVMSQNTAVAEHVVFSVTDNGSGMDEATLSRIFDPFFTTKFTGRGLGLAAVLGIVNGHHGSMWLESMLGNGTRFELYFPVPHTSAPSEPLDVPAGTSKRDTAVTTANILIVDDEPSVREVMADILSEAGYHVVQTSSGHACLHFVQEAPPEMPIQLILLDYAMPQLNGLETLRRLRAQKQTIPVIISSGYAHPHDLSPTPALEPVFFLPKPFTPEQLLTAVGNALHPQT